MGERGYVRRYSTIIFHTDQNSGVSSLPPICTPAVFHYPILPQTARIFKPSISYKQHWVIRRTSSGAIEFIENSTFVKYKFLSNFYIDHNGTMLHQNFYKIARSLYITDIEIRQVSCFTSNPTMFVVAVVRVISFGDCPHCKEVCQRPRDWVSGTPIPTWDAVNQLLNTEVQLFTWKQRYAIRWWKKVIDFQQSISKS